MSITRPAGLVCCPARCTSRINRSPFRMITSTAGCARFPFLIQTVAAAADKSERRREGGGQWAVTDGGEWTTATGRRLIFIVGGGGVEFKCWSRLKTNYTPRSPSRGPLQAQIIHLLHPRPISVAPAPLSHVHRDLLISLLTKICSRLVYGAHHFCNH